MEASWYVDTASMHLRYSQCGPVVLAYPEAGGDTSVQSRADLYREYTPVLKQKTSRQHPRSSHPPNIHAMLSMRVTVCARVPCNGIAPYTGARLQCISVAGESSTSFACGRWGVFRTLCVGGGALLVPLPSRPSLSRPDWLFSSLSLSLSLSLSRSRSLTVAGDPDRCLRGVATPLSVSPLVDRPVPDRVRPEGVRWLVAEGVLEGAPALLRLVVLPAGLKVVAEPVTAWWKYGERALGVSGLSSGTSVSPPTRGESSTGRGSVDGMDGRLQREDRDDELKARKRLQERVCRHGFTSHISGRLRPRDGKTTITFNRSLSCPLLSISNQIYLLVHAPANSDSCKLTRRLKCLRLVVYSAVAPILGATQIAFT